MRQVGKRDEPLVIREWKQLANENWKPAYGMLQNPEKAELHLALMAEQFYTCCYCGRAISFLDSHIEHFRPRESYPELGLEYDNLFASCIRETVRGAELHCGHAKGDWFEHELSISPLEEECASRFNFAFDGKIQPNLVGDAAAAKMIEVLGLQAPFLVNRRQAVLAGLFDEDFLMTATDAELWTLAEHYANPVDGKLDGFFHVVVRVAEWLRSTLS